MRCATRAFRDVQRATHERSSTVAMLRDEFTRADGLPCANAALICRDSAAQRAERVKSDANGAR